MLAVAVAVTVAAVVVEMPAVVVEMPAAVKMVVSKAAAKEAAEMAVVAMAMVVSKAVTAATVEQGVGAGSSQVRDTCRRALARSVHSMPRSR